MTVRSQIYARATAPTAVVTPYTGIDEMPDFELIGGTYNDPAAAVANTSALQAFLDDPNETAPAIRFGGEKVTYPNGEVARRPGRAYFATGVTVPSGKPFLLDGGNSRLSWTGLAAATDPAITVLSGAGSVRRSLSCFDLDTNGSGIRLVTPGKGTILREIRVGAATSDNDPSTGAGTVSLDDLADLDTAAYGFKIEDSDGFTFVDCSVISPGDHGVIVKGRLQDGVARNRIWGAKAGTGWKGENINGSQLDIVSESNYGYGVHLAKCGMPVYDGSSMHIARSKPNVSDIWTEANNGRGTTVSGARTEQNYFWMCGSQLSSGNNNWGDNKIRMPEGTRNSCVLVQDMRVEQSVATMYDLNQEDSASPTYTLPDQSSAPANNNFATAWPTGQPSVTATGTPPNTQWLITFPANSFGQITGATAYWRPWGLLTNFTPQIEDTYIWELEIEGDSNAVAWCESNRNVNSNILVPVIAPYAGPGDAREFGIWNSQPRKLKLNVGLAATGTGLYATPAFTWDPGLPDNVSPMTLTIRATRFYGIRGTGGKIPQS